MELYKRCPDRQNKPEPACSARTAAPMATSQPRILDVIEAAHSAGMMDRSGTAATRERAATTIGAASLPLALKRAAARLPHRADGTPYPFYGLLEPYEALE